MRNVAIVLAVLLVAGCGAEKKKKENVTKKPSVAQEMIDGATGRTAVRHGKRAMETLERVSAQEQQDLEEVLSE